MACFRNIEAGHGLAVLFVMFVRGNWGSEAAASMGARCRETAGRQTKGQRALQIKIRIGVKAASLGSRRNRACMRKPQRHRPPTEMAEPAAHQAGRVMSTHLTLAQVKPAPRFLQVSGRQARLFERVMVPLGRGAHKAARGVNARGARPKGFGINRGQRCPIKNGRIGSVIGVE